MSYVRDVKKAIVGKRIVGATANAFWDGRGGWAHNWRLKLEDGTWLFFIPSETESMVMGVELGVVNPDKLTYTVRAGMRRLGVK